MNKSELIDAIAESAEFQKRMRVVLWMRLLMR